MTSANEETPSNSRRKATWQQTCPRFKPCLGAGIKKDQTLDDFYTFVRYPVIASPKLDGIRCLLLNNPILDAQISRPVCRSLLDVPNHYLFGHLSLMPPGLDGELITYHPGDMFDKTEKVKPFYRIQSDIMSFNSGFPIFKYHIFDYHDFNAKYPHMEPFAHRLEKLKRLNLPAQCVLVEQRLCRDREELEAFREDCVKQGYEGICWRHPDSHYKYGRSTQREQILMKSKDFIDDEAVIIGVYEEMQNNNPQTLNALGSPERSSHQSNMKGKGRLGGLTLRCKNFDMDFDCGSGFDADQRQNMWFAKETLIGKTVTFKYQPFGSKDRPRIPIFKSIRTEVDL